MSWLKNEHMYLAEVPVGDSYTPTKTVSVELPPGASSVRYAVLTQVINTEAGGTPWPDTFVTRVIRQVSDSIQISISRTDGVAWTMNISMMILVAW